MAIFEGKGDKNVVFIFILSQCWPKMEWGKVFSNDAVVHIFRCPGWRGNVSLNGKDETVKGKWWGRGGCP